MNATRVIVTAIIDRVRQILNLNNFVVKEDRAFDLTYHSGNQTHQFFNSSVGKERRNNGPMIDR